MSAESLNELGNELMDENRFAEAERAYARATEAAPAWSVPWYNLGLLYKSTRRWSDSVRCNQRAVELDPDDGDAWWNLGIAATAVSFWSEARRAWQRCGIELPDGTEEPHLDLGPIPVRLSGGSEGEVVWCDRIDPARAIIRNIPLPISGHREGDLLLHDGAPNGYRLWREREYPVFDALQVLQPSDRSTFEAIVTARGESELRILSKLSEDAGIVMEDWESIAVLCKKCSEGVPHTEHDQAAATWNSERRVGFSARSAETVTRVLDSWAAAAPGARVLRMQRVSGT